MAYVCPNFCRLGQTNLRVEIGAVHIHLPTIFMYNLARLRDARLEYAERRWICNHNGSKVFGVLGSLLFEVGHIKVSLRVAFDDNYLHASHGGRGRVGAVCRDRD
ncbi:hypothetical protein BC937DRAFT_87659 [Endogone sp. FLAS-F59071]|nr:hypothetical protein BC937DRAFT_87659 [Endogone sp. FLAS-F59071]|eukprot:RUS19335.1 hypothetical protein BC937DRAFT_87659 [Endogone sp. FLAS-F59071]